MSPVAPRSVYDVSYVTRNNQHHNHFSWQAQHLVMLDGQFLMLECDFSWQPELGVKKCGEELGRSSGARVVAS